MHSSTKNPLKPHSLTKIIPAKKYSDKKRMDRLGASSLKQMRSRGDIMEVYKITSIIGKVDNQYLFLMIGGSKIRQHKFKVRGRVFKRGRRGKFPPQRIVLIASGMQCEKKQKQ